MLTTVLFATLLAQYPGVYPGTAQRNPDGFPPAGTPGLSPPRDALRIEIPLAPPAALPNYRIMRHVELETELLPALVKSYEVWMEVHPKAPAGSPYGSHLQIVSAKDGERGKAFRKAMEKVVKALKDAGY